MKYKPNKEQLNCTICGKDTNENINGTPLCFDCICQMQDGDDDIIKKVEKSDFDPIDKTIEGIILKIQEYTGIKDITIKTRKREVVEARQIAHDTAKNKTSLSLAAIGWQIGRKDHATVLHSLKVVKNLKKGKMYMKKYGGLFEYYE